MSEVWPIVDAVVLHPHEVDEAVAGHVGQHEGVVAVGEQEDGAVGFAGVVGDAFGGEPAVAAVRPEHEQAGGRREEQVGPAVSVDVDAAGAVGGVPDVGDLAERLEPVPVAVAGPRPRARLAWGAQDDLQAAVAVKVLELGVRQRHAGSVGQRHPRAEQAIPFVAFVPPRAAGFGEEAGQALAVEVDPLGAGEVEALGEVGGAPDQSRRRSDARVFRRWNDKPTLPTPTRLRTRHDKGP